MTRELSSCPHTEVTVLLFHPLYRIKFNTWEMMIIVIIGWLTLVFSVSVTLLCRSTRKKFFLNEWPSIIPIYILFFITFTFKRLELTWAADTVSPVSPGNRRKQRIKVPAVYWSDFLFRTAEDSRIFFFLPTGSKKCASFEGNYKIGIQ